jgi:hypothetical protein
MVHFLSVLQGDHRELIHFAYSLMDQSLITNSISIMRITWGRKGKNLDNKTKLKMQTKAVIFLIFYFKKLYEYLISKGM